MCQTTNFFFHKCLSPLSRWKRAALLLAVPDFGQRRTI